jgi:hypothetical protein
MVDASARIVDCAIGEVRWANCFSEFSFRHRRGTLQHLQC